MAPGRTTAVESMPALRQRDTKIHLPRRRVGRVRAWAAASVLAMMLFAGCGGKSETTTSTTGTTSTYTPPPIYALKVRIVSETADGPPIEKAEVYAVAANSTAAKDPSLMPGSLTTDPRGEARAIFRTPETLFVQAFGPGDGAAWTREGMLVRLGTNVTSDRPLRIDNGTLVLPLLHAALDVAAEGTWTTSHATPNPPGNATPAFIAFPLPIVPDAALSAAYLNRLTRADVTLRWANTENNFADLAVGLSWGNGSAEVVGPDGVQTPVPASWSESYSGPVPAGDRAKGLYVVAVTNKAVVGDVALHFTARLHFTGEVPDGLAKPPCYPMARC